MAAKKRGRRAPHRAERRGRPRRPRGTTSGPMAAGLDRHVGTPGMGRPMGVELGQDLSGNPAFLPNANTGGPSSSENIGDASGGAGAHGPEHSRDPMDEAD